MKALRILQYPHPILRQVATPHRDFDDALRDNLNQMLDLMYSDNAVGLAANQVGLLSRYFVMDISPDNNQPMRIINPKIVAFDGQMDCDEGCLSLPGVAIKVLRAKNITLHYQDEYGIAHSLELDGLASNCVQHELDHLDGILFIDKLSKLKRSLLLKKFEKMLKQTS